MIDLFLGFIKGIFEFAGAIALLCWTLFCVGAGIALLICFPIPTLLVLIILAITR